MGRAVRRVVRRVLRSSVRAVDTVTGDILDLDQSKQQEQIKKMQEAQEKAQQQAEAQKKAEKDYQTKVAAERDKLDKESSIASDNTGVGLSDVKIDFTKNLKSQDDEDDLKKLLQRY